MTDPILIAPPEPLLTAAEVRAHLHIDDDEQDTQINLHIAAAARWMDGSNGILGRCILPQTWASRMPSLHDAPLPFPDVQSAVVSYLDTAGVAQTVEAAHYRVRTRGGRGELIFDAAFDAPEVLTGRDDAVTVTAIYGFTEVPPTLKAAALALVGFWLRNTEGAMEDIPASVMAMVRPYRVVMFR